MSPGSATGDGAPRHAGAAADLDHPAPVIMA
jgi:hypothetical protein